LKYRALPFGVFFAVTWLNLNDYGVASEPAVCCRAASATKANPDCTAFHHFSL